MALNRRAAGVDTFMRADRTEIKRGKCLGVVIGYSGNGNIGGHERTTANISCVFLVQNIPPHYSILSNDLSGTMSDCKVRVHNLPIQIKDKDRHDNGCRSSVKEIKLNK